jgi:stress-induced morphogen
MDSVMERVTSTLTEKLKFSAEELHLESTSSGAVGGHIVSPRFKGMSQLDRQDLLWRVLEKELPADVAVRIVAILTVTPEEIAD